MQDGGLSATAADAFTHFHDSMSCLLQVMRRTIAEGGPLPDGSLLAEQVFLGDGYALRLVCRQEGARPFLACLDRPWRHQVSLGRLDKDGKVRVFSYSLRLFYDVLAEQEVLDVFRRDMEKALVLHQQCQARSGTDAGAFPVPDGCRGGRPVH